MSKDVFNNSALSPTRQVSEWVDIRKELGTRSQGVFMGYWISPGKDGFQDQVSFALRDFDDESIVRGVSVQHFYKDEIAKFNIGDEVGVEYYADIPAKKAGHKPMKAVRFYNEALRERERQNKVTVNEAQTDNVEQNDFSDIEEQPL